MKKTRMYKGIDHQYDVWHFAKSICKKLRKAGQKKANKLLLEWIPAINNHLWWCANTCKGDKELLREMWTSILYHTTNRHRWAGAIKFRRCQHRQLTRAEQKKKKWMAVDTSPYKALEAIVNDKKTLEDIQHLNKFCHTGQLEVFHSVMTKYCPKREHFSHPCMVARTQLAVIDHNHNTGRQQATTKGGELRYRSEYTKQKGAWGAKIIYEEKDHTYRHALMQSAVRAASGEINLPDVHPVNLPPNLTGEKAPAKEDLVKSLKSRMK